MFSHDSSTLPSSPCTISKSCWEDIMGDTFSYEHGIFCHSSSIKEFAPRTESHILNSKFRQIPYSPVIKQESECGYSQAEYTYISSTDYFCMTPANRLFTSTPKVTSWESLFDDNSKLLLDLAEQHTSLDALKKQNDLEDSSKTFGAVSVTMLSPIPKQTIAMLSDLSAPKIFLQTPHEKTYFVTLSFTELKSLLRVVGLSGPAQEYRLPVFRNLEPLDAMLRSGKYDMSKQLSGSNSKQEAPYMEKRYVSRLTRKQLALVLGVQNYDISLVKDIENVILTMCDQLCGLKIGESSWSRIPRPARKDAVMKVHRFAAPFFPAFTMDNVLTIIKRGAYSRTQEFLRRKRRRERKYCIEQNVSSMMTK